MKIIIFNRHKHPTARGIARAIRRKGHIVVETRSKSKNRKAVRNEPRVNLLRWGDDTELRQEDLEKRNIFGWRGKKPFKELNHYIKNSKYKKRMYDLLKQNNVKTPEVYERLPDHRPVMKYGRFGNKGINLEGENERAKFYTNYIPFKHEYRVHVFKNEVIGVYRKVPYDEDETIYIKHDENTKFYRVLPRYVNTDICKKAVNSLKLDFGGVDLGQTEDNEWYVIEVNSAVGLNSKNRERYADKIIEHFS